MINNWSLMWRYHDPHAGTWQSFCGTLTLLDGRWVAP